MGGRTLVFTLQFRVLSVATRWQQKSVSAQGDSAETTEFQLLSWPKGFAGGLQRLPAYQQKKKRQTETSRRDFIVTRHVYVGFLGSRVIEDNEAFPDSRWWVGCSWLPWAAFAHDYGERGCASPHCNQPPLAMQMCSP